MLSALKKKARATEREGTRHDSVTLGFLKSGTNKKPKMDVTTDPSAQYALVGAPIRNVVVLRMPTDPANERSKMLIADRDTLTLEQV
jgi:hypothetical protein